MKYVLRSFLAFNTYKLRGLRPLLKDPIALFSGPWLYKKFGMDVVVVIRHPAAFAGSLKRKHWTFDFNHFKDQPLLMRDHFTPFAGEIEQYAAEEHDIIDQSILLWRLMHYMISKYKKEYSGWIFIRHEDLSSDPVNGFKSLFKSLSLEYNDAIDREIKLHSDDANKDVVEKKEEIGRASWRERG